MSKAATDDVVDLVESSDEEGDPRPSKTAQSVNVGENVSAVFSIGPSGFQAARFYTAVRAFQRIVSAHRQAQGGARRLEKQYPSQSGTGYQGSMQDSRAAAGGMARAACRAAQHDTAVVTALRELRRSLPDSCLNEPQAECVLACLCSGYAPSGTSGLCPSLVSWLCAFLHGSLMDLCDRRRLAGVAISLVCSLASNAGLRAALLYVHSEAADAGKTRQATVLQNNPRWNHLDASLAALDPPPSCVYSRLQTLAQQSSVFLQGTTSQASVHVVGDEQSDQLQITRDLSSLVSGAAADVERVVGAMARGAQALGGASTGIAASMENTASAAAVAFEREMMPFAYATVPSLAKQHVLVAKLQVPAPASVRQLMRVHKELARASSEFVKFGASILLRSDEGRCNVLKALISGPRDSPYAFGLWGFDIALPPTYPDKCPLVQFTTTGGGTVRFNPNLYANGEVCLSLLGTWQGPGWDPKHSTLGQVLMSIQALILCEHPIHNEPCYAKLGAVDKTRAELYNCHLQLATLLHGILPFIGNAPAGFEDAVDVYWRHHAADVVHAIDGWLTGARGLAARLPPAPSASAVMAGSGSAAFAYTMGSGMRPSPHHPLMQVFMQATWTQACATATGLCTQMQAAVGKVKEALKLVGYI